MCTSQMHVVMVSSLEASSFCSGHTFYFPLLFSLLLSMFCCDAPTVKQMQHKNAIARKIVREKKEFERWKEVERERKRERRDRERASERIRKLVRANKLTSTEFQNIPAKWITRFWDATKNPIQQALKPIHAMILPVKT